MTYNTKMAKMSLPQKRMMLQAATGHRAHLTIQRLGGEHYVDVEVLGISVELLGDPDKATGLVVRIYGEDNRLATVPMAQVLGCDTQPWNLTDPRHPEYEHPGRVVRAAAHVQRRGSTVPVPVSQDAS